MSGDLWAGAEMQLLMTAGWLNRQPGLRLAVVLFNEGRLARELRQIDVDVTILDETRLSNAQLMRQLASLLRERRIDILHMHKYKDCVLGTIAAGRAGVQHLVRTMHGMAEPMTGWSGLKSRVYHRLDRWMLRRADLIVAVSQQMAEALRESGFRPTMVTCIHNGIDVSQVRASRSREEVRRELGIPDEALLIGTAGRLTPVKGQTGLLGATARILDEDASARCVIVGEGPLSSQLLSLAQDLRIDHACRFVGPRSDVFDFMAAMDVFVLPSLNEGIPMALLEAMVLGAPVVAAAVGGIPEVIQHRVNGLLVPAGDVQALADACLELARDRCLAKALAAAGVRTIAENFSHTSSGEALLFAYRGVALVSNGYTGGRW